MKVIFDTDLSYYNTDWECNVEKHISLVSSCKMYAIFIEENDENNENIERFEMFFRTYSYDEALTYYKRLVDALTH